MSLSETNKNMCKLEKHLKELIDSEEKYVAHLDIAVNRYLAEFKSENPMVPIPEDLKALGGSLVFGNIEDIYNWHKDFFFPALQKSHPSATAIANLFLQSSDQFKMYATYSSLYSISQYYVQEQSEYMDLVLKQFNDKLTIYDYLLKPIQRLAYYCLTLQNISKTLKEIKSDEWMIVSKAASMISNAMHNVNDVYVLEGTAI